MTKNKNYEDALMNEFNERTQNENNVYENIKEKEVVTDLGKVANPMGLKNIQREELDEDPQIKKMKELINFVRLPIEQFPSQGKFYPIDFNVHIRAARVGEIREYSMMDETNPTDIIDKMNYIIASCSKITFGNRIGSYKDILDHDRFYLIKRIQELTFKNGEGAINIPVPDNACKTHGCHPQKEIRLTSEMIERADSDERLEQYYDSENRCYSIKTKNYGVIKIAPPTIGVTNIVRDWAVNRTQAQQHWDQSLVQMIPFFQRDWRGFTDKDIFQLATEFENWDAGKYSLIYRLVEIMNASVGMSPNIHTTCESCGGDLEVPVMFQSISDDGKEVKGGFKSLFVPSLSNQFDELI